MDPLSLFECSVCLESFDAKERRPKVVTCGHTFCLSCVQQIGNMDGANAKCPEDRSKIDARQPKRLKDNKFILSCIEDLKTRKQADLRAAAVLAGPGVPGGSGHPQVPGGPGGDRHCRATLLQEMLRQVEDAVSQCAQLPEADNSSAGAYQLDQELQLLTSSERVSVSCSSWRGDRLELSEQPALRLAMLLMMHQGSLKECRPEAARPVEPAHLQVVDVSRCCKSAPGNETEEKSLLLLRDSPIHVLTGVSWRRDPDWVEQLLSRHAATLQELQVTSLCSIGASALSRLPELRKLSLLRLSWDCRAVPERWLGRLQSLVVSCGFCEALPGLLRAHRDSLQEVHLDNVRSSELLELQRMPKLRKLSLMRLSRDCRAEPERWQGRLQSLEVLGRFLFEALPGLLRAHRDSLQEVHLNRLGRAELLELQRMPALRSLRIWSAGVIGDCVLPGLWEGRLRELHVKSAVNVTPRQELTIFGLLRANRESLQDVRLINLVSRKQLLEVQQMPALQKLSLGSSALDLLDNPVLPEVWLCRLQELTLCGFLPHETVRSVVCAHRGLCVTWQ